MDRELTVRFPGGVRVDALFDGKVVETDQPAKQGGEGRAPDPSDLFFASIATCAGFYALEFCRRRSIDTNGLAVRVRTTWDPAKKLHRRIRIEVGLPAGFPEKYVAPIIRAVDLCSVKRHLLHPPRIETVVM
jgi:putative redox protein